MLVGHSYGGSVMSNAALGKDNVKASCSWPPSLLRRVRASQSSRPFAWQHAGRDA